MTEPNKKFKIHWIGTKNKTEDIEGKDMADAFNRAGYSSGALRAVDWIEEISK